MVGHHTIEVAKTVLEVADVAWTALEFRHHRQHHEQHEAFNRDDTPSSGEKEEDELESLMSENRRLRSLLEQNLELLQTLAESPCLLQDCPPDLHAQLMATMDSTNFLSQLKSLRQKSVDGTGCKFPFREASGADLQSDEIIINVGLEEPSWWVWVTEEMVSNNVEERSGIDNENYVIVSEEHVVDGVANFMARCVLSNPKAQSLTPEELQKTNLKEYIIMRFDSSCGLITDDMKFEYSALTKALGGMNNFEKMLNVWQAGMMFYALSTWGLALFGLYKSRAVVRLAAMGVHSTTKLALKVL